MRNLKTGTITIPANVSTLRSWEQGKRDPSGAARMLITIAVKHPEVLREVVA